MRLFLAALLTMTGGLTAAHASTQQQCEALLKPVSAKIASLPDIKNRKPTPQECAQSAEAIKMYVGYQAQADRMNCAFAYVGGQKIGGAEERAELLADIRKAHAEKCR